MGSHSSEVAAFNFSDMSIQSLDPRVSRLGLTSLQNDGAEQATENQFATFQVFTQKKEDKPFEHGGIVHAPNIDMALIFAKEQYSRRFTCSGLAVTATTSVRTTDISENKEDIYNFIQEPAESNSPKEAYEIFHLNKRGKQTVYTGSVEAGSYEEAAWEAKKAFHGTKPVYNLWIIRRDDILFIDEEDKDIWSTLGEKKYRDALDYKATDKIKAFKEEQNQ